MKEPDKIEVSVDTEVNPTEDIDKVRIAVYKVFGELSLEVVEGGNGKLLRGKAKGSEALSKFYDLLRRERILDAARKILFRGIRENKIAFYLNKQAAYAGHISFSQPMGESPLGPIHVEVQCENPRALIDWLAPRTS
ncbi:MAG: RNA-binding domain-containing protein [Candidatus Bathyarchaeia archaeon]